MEHCKNCEYEKTPSHHEPCFNCIWRQEKFIDTTDCFKPKQPKVLTADQAAEKYNSESANPMSKIENAFFRVGYNYARKYWRLERDQELRPAIELARKAYPNFYNPCVTKEEFDETLHELDEELNNLKPVNGNE
jgi:hypothetical protein